MEDIQPTQEATQRLLPTKKSMYMIPDAEDIICILRPNSPAACKVVENAGLDTPQHVLFDREDVDSDDDMRTDDGQEAPSKSSTRKALNLALRMSSNVRDPAMGFVFGRDPKRSDIVIKTGLEDSRISSKHFRIFLNDSHILMIEDHSTNGTRVDRHHISCKVPYDTKRILSEGTQISVSVFGDRTTKKTQEAIFTVSLPERDGAAYAKNLANYVSRIDHAKNAPMKPPDIKVGAWDQLSPTLITASTERFNFGMHWNGLPKYRVLGKIGSGAFATVYKLSTMEGEPYAVKEIDIKKVVKDGVLGQNVNNELTIMKRLSHPHVVKFCDWQEFGTWLYIIMEYIPCGDLSPYTTESRLLPKGDIQQVAYQICQALQHIHSVGITHRDIKPENILVQSKSPLVVKLTDFGLSKMVHNETFMKTFCGTLLYCAPEVYPDFERLRSGEPRLRKRAERSSPYSSAVDIWSFGAVLHQLLVGRPPIKGANSGVEMLEAILGDEIDYPRLGREGVSQNGLDFLSCMLTVDACDRISAAMCLRHPWLRNLNGHNSQGGMQQSGGSRVKPERVKSEKLITPFDGPPVPLTEPSGKLVDPAGHSGSFSHAAAGLLGSRIGGTNSSSDSMMDLPDMHPEKEEEEPSQWSPREPKPNTTGSDSDEILPDIQEVANQIAAGKSEAPITELAVNSSIIEFGFAPHDQSLVDSFGNASDIGRSMIGDLTPLQKMALRRQSEQQGPAGPLFGEVTTPGFPESGVFGRKSRPLIRRENGEPRGSSLHGAEEQMDVLQVSPPQENGSRAAFERPPPTALPKRILELSGDHGEAEKTSKRSMTRNYRIPSSPSVSFAEPPVPSRGLLGKLTPRPGSFSRQALEIYDSWMAWGRARPCTHIWPDPLDVRVPKCGIEIVFFQRNVGVYNRLLDPLPDWERVLCDSCAFVMTRSRVGIKVNDVRLKSRVEGEGVYRCGRLRTGDVIEVFNDRVDYLAYECEFYVGESARIRMKDEPFMVEKNAELGVAAATVRDAKEAANAAQKSQ